MSEFEEITHPGGRIELVRQPDGAGFQVRLSGVRRTALFGLIASAQGQPLDIIRIGGYAPSAPPPEPEVSVYVFSDTEGLLGRKCPACGCYFRTDNCVVVPMHCPYCGHTDHCLAFTTENQLTFVKRFCDLFGEAENSTSDTVVVDLNEFVDQLPKNRTGWVYSEQRQQNKFECSQCRTVFDILGEYGGCPTCAKRTSSVVFQKKMAAIQTRFDAANAEMTDRHQREDQWRDLLGRCVSEFEAMAKDLQTQLLRLPAIPKRKTDLNHLSFQNILKANACFSGWYGFEILEDISPQDREFLTRMFNRRHVFAHNGGRVDQEYLNNTGDPTVRLNQIIRIRSREIAHLIPLVRQAGENLVRSYESIS